MRSSNPGPAGVLLMLIGALLASSSAWTALGEPDWARAVPSILIGLSLVAVGYSLVSKGREAARRRDP